MDIDLRALIAQALEAYYDDLKNTGSASIDQKYKLLLLTAIQTMLDNMYEYITDSDLRYIAMAVQCAMDGCLIDYPSHYTGDSVFHTFKEFIRLRMTETNEDRVTEQQYLRREM